MDGCGGPPAVASAGGVVGVEVDVGGLLLRSHSALTDGEMVGICEDRDNDCDDYSLAYLFMQ